MEAPTQPEYSIEIRKRTREANIFVKDAQEHVGAPTSFHKKRRSLDMYTIYMALMIELIDSEPF